MRDTKWLIIDSDPLNRRELEKLLSDQGQMADLAIDPSQAGILLGESKYDCILVDRDVPDGWHSSLATARESSDAPLIFLTGPVGSSAPAASAAHFADGYMPRNSESIHGLAEHVRRSITRIAVSRSEKPAIISKKKRPSLDLLNFKNSYIDSRITIRTSTFTNHGPQEDFSLAVDRGDGCYATLFGDFTGPEVLRNLEMIRLKPRIEDLLLECPSPAKMLEELNSELIRATRAVEFLAAVALFIDFSRKLLTWSVAGHEAPLHRRWGSMQWKILPGCGIPLGIQSGEKYAQYTKRLGSGDKILLISDGIFKMRGAGGGLRNRETIINGIDQFPLDAAPNEILEGIEELVQSQTNGQRVADEVTAMLIQL